MKRRITFIFMLLFSVSACCYGGVRENLFLEFTPFCGVQNGAVNEYLKDSTNSYIISSLEWQTKPLWNYGVKADFGFYNFFVSALCNSSVPASCGTMYDSDYTSELKKNLCFLENNVRFCFNADLSFYYKFNLGNSFNINPFLSVNYSYYSFYADNGYGYFGTAEYSLSGKDEAWNSPYARKASKVSSIEYYRHNLTWYTGVKTGFEYGRFSCSLTALISPFCEMSSRDQHNDENNNDVEEDYRMFEYERDFFNTVRFTIDASYRLNSRFSIKCLLDYSTFLRIAYGTTITDKNRGETASGIMSGSTYSLSAQKSGGTTEYFKFYLGLGCRLF